MSYRDLVTQGNARLLDLGNQRQGHANTVLHIQETTSQEHRDPTDEEAAQVRAAVEARDGLDEQIEHEREGIARNTREAEIEERHEAFALEHRDALVGYENQARTSPREIYTRENSLQGVSFFRDMYLSFTGNAPQRFQDYRQQRLNEALQTRAVSTEDFAGLIPPQYLIDLAAPTARAGRPVADSVTGLPLPAEGMQFTIPKGTAGASTDVQTTQNSNVSETDEAWENVTVYVATIAGQQNPSRQSLERGAPGNDALIFSDLSASYAVSADRQVLSGTGTGGQTLGILATAGIGAATAFGAAVDPGLFLRKLTGAINEVQTKRFLSPDVIFMHPRRWNWLLNQVDSANRPLVSPFTGAWNPLGTFADIPDVSVNKPAGQLLTLPVILDANIPTNVGDGDEDQVIAARRGDVLLWEQGDGSPTDLRFEQTLGRQLTITLVAYGYLAVTAGRYPEGIATIGGLDGADEGLAAPVF